MGECVILFRNTGNNKIGFVADDEGDGEIMVYRNHIEALNDVPNVPILRAFPYQIVELDELPLPAEQSRRRPE